MTTRQQSEPSVPIGSRDELVGWFAHGEKPADRWRIGTEHEKFPFYTNMLTPVPYDGPQGIRALMEGLISRYGWEPIFEGDAIIALQRPDGQAGGTVSLEPGGQFELSGDPLTTIHDVADETRSHLAQVKEVGDRLGIGMLGGGFAPTWPQSAVPRMPKPRHVIMAKYMPKVGSRGLDMMFRTCTIQVNLDFASEVDMVKKLRVSLALQPIATALFAASPFSDGKPNGYQSMRSAVWLDTDRARSGNLPFAFESGMGYERYADYALDVPMYFIFRDGRYIDVAGASFRDFMAGRLATTLGRPELAQYVATMDDWSDHLTTLFPDVRLKRFIEMRGADGGLLPAICALPAFWVGLLYDTTALDAAWDLVKSWTAEERAHLSKTVPKSALETPFRTGNVRDVARVALNISADGLARRRRIGVDGDETRYLDPLRSIVTSGKTMADAMLEHYHGDWSGHVEPIFRDFAY